MSLIEDAEPKRRRRGDDLEVALLDAAWSVLQELGFHDLTMDAVAQRAGTSRAVLYRRWPGKFEMVAAAVRHALVNQRGPAPKPTGTLRGDLIAMLTWAGATDVRTLIDATSQLSDYLAEEGRQYDDVRELIRNAPGRRGFNPVDEAIGRGELDPTRVTRRMRGLAFDLFRHEVLVNAQRPSQQTIEEIVDQVVLPVLAQARVER